MVIAPNHMRRIGAALLVLGLVTAFPPMLSVATAQAQVDYTASTPVPGMGAPWCTVPEELSSLRAGLPMCSENEAGRLPAIPASIPKGEGADAGATATGPVGTGPDACLSAPDLVTCPSWIQRLSNPEATNATCEGIDVPVAITTSELSVFVTGFTCAIRDDGQVHADVESVAYDGVSGRELWVQKYDGPLRGNDAGLSVAASPDGRTVVVVGIQDQTPTWPENVSTGDYLTIAYDAETGVERWSAAYTSPDTGKGANPQNPQDLATDVVVSEDGERVYVTGTSYRLSPFPFQEDAATISYVTSTGAQDWVERNSAPSCDNASVDVPVSIESSGRRIYVGEYFAAPKCAVSQNYRVFALEDDRENRRAGLLWGTTYEGGVPIVGDIGVADDAIVLSGTRRERCQATGGNVQRYGTVAFDPDSGDQKWERGFHGEEFDSPRLGPAVCSINEATGLGMSPDGSTAYVTGTVWRGNLVPGHVQDVVSATIAYNTADGSERWVSYEDAPRPGIMERAWDLSVGPEGDLLYLAGMVTYPPSFKEFVSVVWLPKADYLTVALSSADGRRVWSDHYNDSEFLGTTDVDIGYLSAVSPDGSRLFTSGQLIDDAPRTDPNFYDVGTVAYETGADSGPGPTPTATPTPTSTSAPTQSPTANPSPTADPTPRGTSISFTDSSARTGQYSDDTLFEARLTDSNGDPLEGAELTFELTATESSRGFSATTNDDGVAQVTPTLEEKPGPHQLTARYSGDDDHAGDADTVSFVVDKEDTALALSVDGEDDDKTLRARLSDLDTSSEGIAQRTIDFYSDGELIGSRQTDADGIASVPLPPGHRGNNRSYEAVFDGDDFYLASSDERAGKGKGGKGGNGGGNGGGGAGATYSGNVLLM